MQEFDRLNKGMHVTNEHTKRMDIRVTAVEISYEVETVTDLKTGKSVRANTLTEGPSGFQLTWGAVANFIKLHVGFAIPVNRIQMMIGQPEITSGKICRVLHYVAEALDEIYLCLAWQLADANELAGDDTNTKVLELHSESSTDTVALLDEELGFTQPYANGEGEKKKINVSLLVGKTDVDPRSTIRFFRTHLGSVGNLLTKILENRSPKLGPLVIQGDLSTTNLPSKEIREKITILLAGCAAHARRPFWRFKEEDESLCYFMLRGFLMLSQVEAMIDARGRTHQKVLKLRGRYAKMIWLAMRNRCIAAITGKAPSPGTYPVGINPNRWPPGSNLYLAAQYVINHFDELTLYLSYPRLDPTNNGRERALRIEKCMLNSSKFRKTKRGRVILDILRTINATCTTAGVDITDYLRFVFMAGNEAKFHPENYTPFEFAKKTKLLLAAI